MVYPFIKNSMGFKCPLKIHLWPPGLSHFKQLKTHIMKTAKPLFFILIFTILLSHSACKKNDTGGKAEIHALIYHHDTPIMASTLYVKFDMQTQPSDPTENYDLKIEGEDDDNHVHVENMRPGDYYLYAVGYDSIAQQTVK